MSKLFNFASFFLLIPQAPAADLDYCEHVKNCGPQPNIVCERNHECDPVKHCDDVELSLETKRFIVEAFNDHRNEVALGKKGLRKATNMLTQIWDNDLEYVTQCAQNTCEGREENCINTVRFTHTFLLYNKLSRKEVSSDLEFFKKSVVKWIQPGSFTDRDLPAFNNSKRRGYASTIWCNSVGIGCALSRDSDNYHGACTMSGYPRMGEPVYNEGDPCKKCPPGLTCNNRYRGLCGKVILPSENKSSTVGCLISIVVTCIILLTTF